MNRFSAALVALLIVCSVISASGQASSPNPASTENPVAVPPVSPANTLESTSDTADSDSSIDPASLIPDLPALPNAKATLMGGIVQKLDRVQDRVTLQLFGGGKAAIFFDGRTSVYRDGQPASLASLKPGERVYIDTILYDDMVFARNIHLRTGRAQGESQGIVLSYRSNRDQLVVRDATAPKPLMLRVTPNTRILNNGQPSSTTELKEGALVSLKFDAESGGRDTAQQITILAEPGSPFTFTGTVKFLDLHTGLLVLTSATNNKTYEIYLAPSVPVDQSLREGSDVVAQTRFEGDRYMVHTLTVKAPQPK